MNIKKVLSLALCAIMLTFISCSQDELISEPSGSGNATGLKSSSSNGDPVSVSLNYLPAIYLSIYDGTASENPHWKCTDYIMTNATAIAEIFDIYGIENNNGGQVVFWYDANKNFIKADASKFKSEFSTPANAKYIRVNQHLSYPDVPLYRLRGQYSGNIEYVFLQYEDGIYIGYYDGIHQESPYWRRSQQIFVDAGDVFLVEENQGGQVLFWYTHEGVFIKTDESKTRKEFQAPSNASYLYINQHASYSTVPLYRIYPKNLISTYLFCRSIEDNGTISPNENCYWKYTDLIPINPNIKYHTDKKYAGQTIFWYDSSKQFLYKGTEFFVYQDEIKPPSHAAFARILQHVEYPDVPLYECKSQQ